MIDNRKDIDYYKDHVEDIIGLLYDKFYEPIRHKQSFMDKSFELKKEVFYDWLNEQIYNATF